MSPHFGPPALRRDSSRICIDASHILEKDYGSGVQRVTRNVIKCALKTQPKGTVSAVNLARGRIEDVSTRFWHQPGHWLRFKQTISELDMLFMLDGSWELYPKLDNIFCQCHAAGIPIVTCVHDLIPIDLPETCHPGVPELFRIWLDCALTHSEAFVCNSETTARRLQRHIEDSRPNPRTHYKIGWWLLGADFRPFREGRDRPPPALIDGIYVLVVGTLEPRKKHSFVLECFKNLWVEGSSIKLVFAGRQGWKMESFVEEFRGSPEYGTRLRWFNGPSDEELHSLYWHSACVVMASSAEGFGLPLAEAAHYRKPVVVSDIPAFKEIVISNGHFFSNDSHTSFRGALKDALEGDRAPATIRCTTWEESAGSLISLLRNDSFQIQLSDC